MASVPTVLNVNGYTTPVANRALGLKKLTWSSGTYSGPVFTFDRKLFGLRGFDIGVGPMLSDDGSFIVQFKNAFAGSETITVVFFNAADGTPATTLTAGSVAFPVLGG